MRDKLIAFSGAAILALGVVYIKNRIFLDRFRKASESLEAETLPETPTSPDTSDDAAR